MTDTDYDSPPHAGVDSDLGQAKLRQHKRVYGKKGRQNRSGRPGRRRDVTAHSCESEGPCGTRRVVRASRVLKKEKDDVPRDHLSSDAIRDSSDDGSYGSFTGRGKSQGTRGKLPRAANAPPPQRVVPATLRPASALSSSVHRDTASSPIAGSSKQARDDEARPAPFDPNSPRRLRPRALRDRSNLSALDRPASNSLSDRAKVAKDSPPLTTLPPSLLPIERLHSTTRIGAFGASTVHPGNPSPLRATATKTRKLVVLNDLDESNNASRTQALTASGATRNPSAVVIKDVAPGGRSSNPSSSDHGRASDETCPPNVATSSWSANTRHRPSSTFSTAARSTSPIRQRPAELPTFQFTTTVFENSTSFAAELELELGRTRSTAFATGLTAGGSIERKLDHASTGLVGGHKEGDGCGMESTFVLESWDESRFDSSSPSSSSRRLLDHVDVDDLADGGATVLGGDIDASGPFVEPARGGDDAGMRDRREPFDWATSPDRGDRTATRSLEEFSNVGIEGEEARAGRSFRDETSTSTIRSCEMNSGDRMEECEESGKVTRELEGGLLISAIESESSRVKSVGDAGLDSRKEGDKGGSTPAARRLVRHSKTYYDAHHLPPRRPRSPRYSYSAQDRDDPSRGGDLASDEDDLAYLIRTTATHSSEDDVAPSSDPGWSSDEREFQVAEREVGRGVKASSGQRRRRVELAAANRYLKIGPGKGGRRLQWRREIVDGHEADVEGRDALRERIDEGDLGEDEWEVELG